MKIDLNTLELLLCLGFVLEVITLLYQYRMNASKNGIGWWLLGSSCMAGGFFVMILRNDTSHYLHPLMASYTLIVAGQLFLYLGIKRFLRRRVNKKQFLCTFLFFFVVFLIVMFLPNARFFTIVFILAILSFIALLTALNLLLNKQPHLASSTRFTSAVFCIYGLFLFFCFFMMFFPDSTKFLFGFDQMEELFFLVIIIMSTLWTYSFILMVNQHLNFVIMEDKEELEIIFNNSPDAVLLAHFDDGVIVNINEGFTALTGFTRDEVIGKSILSFSIWNNMADRKKLISMLGKNGFFYNMEAIFERKDGRLFTGMISARLIPLHGVSHIIGVNRDITERKQTEIALRDLEEKYRNMISNIPGIAYRCLHDEYWTMKFLSDEAERLLGYPVSDFIDNAVRSFSSVIYTDDKEMIHLCAQEGLLQKKPYSMEYRLVSRDGNIIWVKEKARGIFDSESNLLWIDGVILDISERKRAEFELMESNDKLNAIFNAANTGVSIADQNGKYLIFNKWWADKLGYDTEELYNITVFDITHPDDLSITTNAFKGIINGNTAAYRLEKRYIKKDKTFFWGDASVSVTKDLQNNVKFVIAMVTDITERKYAEEHVHALIEQLEIEKKHALESAMTDGLTGLANRRRFDEVLSSEFYRLKRSGSSLSIIMMDIDYFKKFNDHYGHVEGDECLRQVATVLKNSVVRASDSVSRYGGEEFAAILPGTDGAGAAVLAEHIRKSLADLFIPHADSAVCGCVTISLGVATVNPAKLVTPEQAVVLADRALYLAKKNGRNRVESVGPDMQ